MAIFRQRIEAHDKGEQEVMGLIRRYTTRKHLPDRWVSLNNVIYPWDYKTNIFVEDNSHDEYFRLLDEGYRPFIVYDKGKMAGFIDDLEWDGPHPPSPKSTTGDHYYKISGGKPLVEWLAGEKGLSPPCIARHRRVMIAAERMAIDATVPAPIRNIYAHFVWDIQSEIDLHGLEEWRV